MWNGCRRPFWMSEPHFWWHFWPFHINTKLFFLNYKMDAGDHFRCSRFTFDHISGHFRSIRNFIFFFLQNGHRRPFWMSEIHFWSHFWPFQINTKLLFFLKFFFLQNGRRRPFWMSKIHFLSHFWSIHNFFIFIFYKMAAGAHFGCPKFTFDHISGNFRSIWNFFVLNFFTKWLPSVILDVRNSLSIEFLAISDRYSTLIFLEIFDKMAAVGHFGCPKFTFDRISGHFRSIRYFFFFFYKMAVGGHFGCSKMTFDCISDHFGSIGHFGCLKFTFDSNSSHFISIQNYFFRRPFWMSENHFRSHIWPFQIDRPFWMSEIHFRWHFWPFQIHTDLYFISFIFDKMAAGSHFICPEITFDRISGQLAIDTQLFFWNVLIKWSPAAILDWTTMWIIELVRDIWMSNACVAFEICIYVWDTLRMGLYLSVDIMLLVWTCCSRNGQGRIYI